jgi:potassium efflux system protein
MTRYAVRAFLASCLMALTCLAAVPAKAQDKPAVPAPAEQPRAPAPVATPPAEPRVIPAEVRTARARLDAAKVELDQREAALQRENISDRELQSLRQSLEPLTDQIRTLLAELAPRLDAARARLDQLGKKPEGDAPESEDVARERTERERAVSDVDETQRLGRTLLVQAEQIASTISDRRRSQFARALFERSFSILSPDLWSGVLRAAPREWNAIVTITSDWFRRMQREAPASSAIPVALALAAAIALYGLRERVAARFARRDPDLHDPSRRRKLLAATSVLLIRTLPAALGSLIVWIAVSDADILPPRLEPVAGSILRAIAFYAFVRGLVEAILAPDNASWRLVNVSNALAVSISRFVRVGAAVLLTGKVVETASQAISAALPVTVATRGVFALAVALLFALVLRRATRVADREEDCLGPYVPTEPDLGGPVRSIGWVAVAATIASVLVGYVAFATFLVDQLVWIGVLGALLFFALTLADEFVGRAMKGDSTFATTIQANTGLRRRSLDQIGVIVEGLLRVVLIMAAIMLALAPLGVESTDLLSSLRRAFFGFQVGEVTISLSGIAIALGLFIGGIVLTKLLQGWLERTFLPATELDAGLRNSIRTVFGYLGFFIAAATALSFMGLSLDRIAIVAGALSVGIGFGLQSIVNNFVSGLILLWERPIRVGDLVVVGDGEGHVRKISVRATEIETFDRSTIIVPNSSLISGTVRNRVRSDRTGRIVLPVNVPRNADPRAVETMLIDTARAHRDVMREPGPRVMFRKIGDSNLEFELICFVPEVETQARVQSDLNHEIFRRLLAEKHVALPGPSTLEVRGLEPVQSALGQIAEALDHAADRSSDRAPRRKPDLAP